MNCPVRLLDGPCGGRTVHYGQPLPQTLVVADKTGLIRWHDYTHYGPDTYRHAKDCPCGRRYAAGPVNLDDELGAHRRAGTGTRGPVHRWHGVAPLFQPNQPDQTGEAGEAP
jgi:hypothetical protein